MAKIGTITANPGAATGFAAVAAVADSSPLVARLSQVAQEALRAYGAGLGLAIMDTSGRLVYAALDDSAVRSALTAAEGGVSGITTLTMDEDGSVSPFTATHDSGSFAEIDDALASAKPKFSVPAICNAVEDALALRGEDGFIIIDQANGLVKVLHDTPSTIGSVADTLASALSASSEAHLLATFTQTVGAVSGPKPFGE